jgi:hypothetical protein
MGSELKVFGTPNVVVGWVALLLCIRGGSRFNSRLEEKFF